MNTLRRALLVLFWIGGLRAAETEDSIHFIPKGHALGDVHPFIKDGECYLYYLKPGKYESALAHSTDWLHWKEVPLTHAGVSPDDWMSPYYVLGVFHDPTTKVYRSFYGHHKGRIVSSVSTDLLHWTCAPKEFHIQEGDYYERRRDPYVFWIPEDQQYGCVMTTWMKGKSKETGGAFSLATSLDLKQWQDHGAILFPGNIGEPECPQMFKLGNHWYLLASIYDRAVGGPVYWSADAPKGPWKNDPDGMLDGKDLCAAQVAFDGETPVLFGWIPLKPAKPGNQNWGGHLAIPREIYVQKNGQLGSRLPSALVKAYRQLVYKNYDAFVLINESEILKESWKRLILLFNIAVPEPTVEIRIQIKPIGEIVFQKGLIKVIDNQGECWSKLPITTANNTACKVQIFVDENMVEIFMNDQYSLAARLPEVAGNRHIQFRTTGGQARFSGVGVAEWTRPEREGSK